MRLFLYFSRIPLGRYQKNVFKVGGWEEGGEGGDGDITVQFHGISRFDYVRVCKIRIYMPKITFSNLLTYISFFRNVLNLLVNFSANGFLYLLISLLRLCVCCKCFLLFPCLCYLWYQYSHLCGISNNGVKTETQRDWLSSTNANETKNTLMLMELKANSLKANSPKKEIETISMIKANHL